MTTLEMARELGIAIADSPEYARLCEAKQLLAESPAVVALMNEFNQKQESLVDFMESGELEDKETAVMLTNDLEAVKEQLEGHALFKAVLEAQENFANLIAAVNKEINACIGISEENTTTASCGGDCSHCAGCKH